MAFWEFLIQKEGDRSWLPLESPDVEILEGRYRIVARSSRANTLVEIRITHETTAEFLPIRRLQKRSSRINKDGLVVIFPYTRLLPGSWELRCLGDVMAEMMGDGWQYRVKLQVLPLESTEIDDWEPELPGEITGATGIGLDEPPADSPELTRREPRFINPAKPFSETLPDLLTDPAQSSSNASVDISPMPVSGESVENLEGDGAFHPESEGVKLVEELAIASPAASLQSEASTPETAVDSAALLKTSTLFQVAAQLSEQVVDSVFQDFAPVDESPPSATDSANEKQDALQHSENSSAKSLPAPRPEPIKLESGVTGLQLILEQEMYVVQPDQSLTLKGQVDRLETHPADSSIAARELRVRLYDPQNSQVLVDEYQPLAPAISPFPFSCKVSLPADYQTYLILGELILYGAASDGTPPVLAIQSFSVTTDLRELLDAIANDFAEPELLPQLEISVAGSQQLASNLDVDLPNPIAETPAMPQFQPALSQPLPPQIHSPEPSQNRKPLQLPSFGKGGRALEEVDGAIADIDRAVDIDRADDLTLAESSDIAAPETADSLAIDQFIGNLSTDSEGSSINLNPAHFSEPNASASPFSENTVEPDQSALPAWFTSPDPTPELTAAIRENAPLVQSEAALEASAIGSSTDLSTALPEAAIDLADALSAPVMTFGQGLADPALEWDSIEPRLLFWQLPVNHPQPPATPEDAAFRALNLQERFWTRLHSLATDAESSTWLSSGQSASSGTPTNSRAAISSEFSNKPDEPEDFWSTAVRSNDRSIGLDAGLVDQEIVVEADELPLTAQRFRNNSSTHSSSTPESSTHHSSTQTQVLQPPETWMLPVDEPVPVPQLEIKQGELTAGKAVDVIVKLPNLTSRIFVKLWMRDRQNRSLLDGPHWLMDFLPDGLGNLTTRTQIVPPLGALEIQLEAIAVEITTHRESNKVTMTREIVPPDLSAFSLDEWDV